MNSSEHLPAMMRYVQIVEQLIDDEEFNILDQFIEAMVDNKRPIQIKMAVITATVGIKDSIPKRGDLVQSVIQESLENGESDEAIALMLKGLL